MERAYARRQGSNILLHDGWDRRQGADRTDTIRATDELLHDLLPRGRKPVTVDAWSLR